MRLAEFLGARLGQPPPELVRYRLRQLYQIPPSVLAEQTGENLLEMLRDLQCLRWEHRAAELRRK